MIDSHTGIEPSLFKKKGVLVPSLNGKSNDKQVTKYSQCGITKINLITFPILSKETTECLDVATMLQKYKAF